MHMRNVAPLTHIISVSRVPRLQHRAARPTSVNFWSGIKRRWSSHHPEAGHPAPGDGHPSRRPTRNSLLAGPAISWPGGRPTVICIGAIYRLPAGSAHRAVEQLQEQLRTALTTHKPLLLLGDININVLDTTSAATRHYYTALAELNLVQLIQEPTHLHPTPTCLDHVITNINPTPATTILDADINDHQPVTTEAPIGRLRRRITYRTTRSWRAANWDAICLDLLLADWSSLYTSTDVNQMATTFMKIWIGVLDRYCPVRRRRIRHPDCPWLTNNQTLRAAMAERDAARRAWRTLRTPEAGDKYRRLRNKVKSQLSEARSDYLAQQLVGTDRCAFWQQLKRLYIAPAASAKAPPPTNTDQQRDLATHFNAYFSTVGSNIAAELRDDVAASQLHPRPPVVVAGSFRPRPITLPELTRTIAAMNSSGVVGPDGVSLSTFMKCLPVLAPHLLRMVNTSIVTCVFPESWKIASRGTTVVLCQFSNPVTQLLHLTSGLSLSFHTCLKSQKKSHVISCLAIWRQTTFSMTSSMHTAVVTPRRTPCSTLSTGFLKL